MHSLLLLIKEYPVDGIFSGYRPEMFRLHGGHNSCFIQNLLFTLYHSTTGIGKTTNADIQTVCRQAQFRSDLGIPTYPTLEALFRLHDWLKIPFIGLFPVALTYQGRGDIVFTAFTKTIVFYCHGPCLFPSYISQP